MKNLRVLVPVSVAALCGVGAIVASCGSFTSGGATPGRGTGGSTDTGQGGSTGGGDQGGSTGTGQGGDNGQGGAGGNTTTGAGGKTGAGGTMGMAGARAGAGGTTTTSMGGAPGAGGTVAAATRPCDILAAAGNACAAAHSTVRALFANYTGPLYQVCKGAYNVAPQYTCSGTTQDIGLTTGGYANSAAQDTFCAGGNCVISIIYDQSPNKNDLHPSPPGGAGGVNRPVVANALKVTINGNPVYGVYIRKTQGYRSGCSTCKVTTAKGTAVADQPETMYMVTSQHGLVDGCCFDYGNAETDSRDDGNGTMEAVYFGGGVAWDTGAEEGHNDSSSPWVMADLENGLFAGFSTTNPSAAQKITSNTALRFPFVTALLVGDVVSQNSGRGRFAIYGGDATTGALKVMYDGIRPTLGNYAPMRKQGSIILGTGGDNSNSSEGQWFEGVMASGAATLQTVNAIQANIVAAGYGK